MTITLPPDLAKRLETLAKLRGSTAEAIALEYLTNSAPMQHPDPKLTHEEFVAGLEVLARHSGVSLPDSAWSREEMYD